MKLNPKPVRIEPVFGDREQIRAMFERYAHVSSARSLRSRGASR
jgi:hypothetical protein